MGKLAVWKRAASFFIQMAGAEGLKPPRVLTLQQFSRLLPRSAGLHPYL
jgi:hypothetical protein